MKLTLRLLSIAVLALVITLARHHHHHQPCTHGESSIGPATAAHPHPRAHRTGCAP